MFGSQEQEWSHSGDREDDEFIFGHSVFKVMLEHSGRDSQEAELKLAFLEFLCEYLTSCSLQVDNDLSTRYGQWADS